MKVSRLAIAGSIAIIVGLNTSIGVIFFVLFGGTLSLSWGIGLFWGGIVLNFAGFGLLVCSIISKRFKRQPQG